MRQRCTQRLNLKMTMSRCSFCWGYCGRGCRHRRGSWHSRQWRSSRGRCRRASVVDVKLNKFDNLGIRRISRWDRMPALSTRKHCRVGEKGCLTIRLGVRYYEILFAHPYHCRDIVKRCRRVDCVEKTCVRGGGVSRKHKCRLKYVPAGAWDRYAVTNIEPCEYPKMPKKGP